MKVFDIFSKTIKVASAIALHTLASLMVLVGIWAVQRFYELLYRGKPELLFGQVPLAYLFQAMDVAVFAVLLWKSCRELWDAFDSE